MIRHNGVYLDRCRQTIRHREQKKVFFTHQVRGGHAAVGFKIWEALILGAMNRWELFDYAYGDQVDGGPIAGENVIDIRLHQWLSEFERMEMLLDRDKRGGFVFYRLVPF